MKHLSNINKKILFLLTFSLFLGSCSKECIKSNDFGESSNIDTFKVTAKDLGECFFDSASSSMTEIEKGGEESILNKCMKGYRYDEYSNEFSKDKVEKVKSLIDSGYIELERSKRTYDTLIQLIENNNTMKSFEELTCNQFDVLKSGSSASEAAGKIKGMISSQAAIDNGITDGALKTLSLEIYTQCGEYCSLVCSGDLNTNNTAGFTQLTWVHNNTKSSSSYYGINIGKSSSFVIKALGTIRTKGSGATSNTNDSISVSNKDINPFSFGDKKLEANENVEIGFNLTYEDKKGVFNDLKDKKTDLERNILSSLYFDFKPYNGSLVYSGYNGNMLNLQNPKYSSIECNIKSGNGASNHPYCNFVSSFGLMFKKLGVVKDASEDAFTTLNNNTLGSNDKSSILIFKNSSDYYKYAQLSTGLLIDQENDIDDLAKGDGDYKTLLALTEYTDNYYKYNIGGTANYVKLTKFKDSSNYIAGYKMDVSDGNQGNNNIEESLVNSKYGDDVSGPYKVYLYNRLEDGTECTYNISLYEDAFKKQIKSDSGKTFQDGANNDDTLLVEYSVKDIVNEWTAVSYGNDKNPVIFNNYYVGEDNPNNKSYFTISSSDGNCMQNLSIRLVKLKEITVPKTGFLFFHNALLRDRKVENNEAESEIKVQVVNPGIASLAKKISETTSEIQFSKFKTEMDKNIFEYYNENINEFKKLKILSDSEIHAIENLNGNDNNTNDNINDIYKNSGIFVREGQIIRIDDSAWINNKLETRTKEITKENGTNDTATEYVSFGANLDLFYFVVERPAIMCVGRTNHTISASELCPNSIEKAYDLKPDSSGESTMVGVQLCPLVQETFEKKTNDNYPPKYSSDVFDSTCFIAGSELQGIIRTVTKNTNRKENDPYYVAGDELFSWQEKVAITEANGTTKNTEKYRYYPVTDVVNKTLNNLVDIFDLMQTKSDDEVKDDIRSAAKLGEYEGIIETIKDSLRECAGDKYSIRKVVNVNSTSKKNNIYVDVDTNKLIDYFEKVKIAINSGDYSFFTNNVEASDNENSGKMYNYMNAKDNEAVITFTDSDCDAAYSEDKAKECKYFYYKRTYSCGVDTIKNSWCYGDNVSATEKENIESIKKEYEKNTSHYFENEQAIQEDINKQLQGNGNSYNCPMTYKFTEGSGENMRQLTDEEQDFCPNDCFKGDGTKADNLGEITFNIEGEEHNCNECTIYSTKNERDMARSNCKILETTSNGSSTEGGQSQKATVSFNLNMFKKLNENNCEENSGLCTIKRESCLDFSNFEGSMHNYSYNEGETTSFNYQKKHLTENEITGFSLNGTPKSGDLTTLGVKSGASVTTSNNGNIYSFTAGSTTMGTEDNKTNYYYNLTVNNINTPQVVYLYNLQEEYLFPDKGTKLQNGNIQFNNITVNTGISFEFKRRNGSNLAMFVAKDGRLFDVNDDGDLLDVTGGQKCVVMNSAAIQGNNMIATYSCGSENNLPFKWIVKYNSLINSKDAEPSSFNEFAFNTVTGRLEQNGKGTISVTELLEGGNFAFKKDANNGKETDNYNAALYFKIIDDDKYEKNNSGFYTITIEEASDLAGAELEQNWFQRRQSVTDGEITISTSSVISIFNTLFNAVLGIMDGQPYGIVKAKTGNCGGKLSDLKNNGQICFIHGAEQVSYNGMSCGTDGIEGIPDTEGMASHCFKSCDQKENNEKCTIIYNNGGILKLMYTNLISDTLYQFIVKLALITMITLYGFGYFLGLSEFSQKEMMMRIIKSCFIYALISETGWQLFDMYVVSFFKQGIDSLLFLIASSFEMGSFNYIENAIMANDYSNKLILFSSSFQNLKMLFSDALLYKMIGLIFSGWLGILYAYLVLTGFITYIVGIINAIILYLMSQVFMSIALAIGPLVFILMFYDRTKKSFDNWLGILMGFALQEIFIIVTLSFFNNLINSIVKTVFRYRVCILPIIDISLLGVPLSLLQFWKIPGTGFSGGILDLQNQAGPSFYSIMTFYIVANLSNKFVGEMADIGNELGGGIKVTEIASPLTQSVSDVGNKLNGLIGSASMAPISRTADGINKHFAQEHEQAKEERKKEAEAFDAAEGAVESERRRARNLKKAGKNGEREAIEKTGDKELLRKYDTYDKNRTKLEDAEKKKEELKKRRSLIKHDKNLTKEQKNAQLADLDEQIKNNGDEIDNLRGEVRRNRRAFNQAAVAFAERERNQAVMANMRENGFLNEQFNNHLRDRGINHENLDENVRGALFDNYLVEQGFAADGREDGEEVIRQGDNYLNALEEVRWGEDNVIRAERIGEGFRNFIQIRQRAAQQSQAQPQEQQQQDGAARQQPPAQAAAAQRAENGAVEQQGGDQANVGNAGDENQQVEQNNEQQNGGEN